ncbi:restriction endonuclease, partial [Mycobacterium rufum]|nr:restriction endonuclease [Mycolicibacterium rufum]
RRWRSASARRLRRSARGGGMVVPAHRRGHAAAAPLRRRPRRRRGHAGARESAARDQMSGTEFEDHVARIARSAGVPVIMTPLSGDWGVDLIVGHRPHRLAVQCKRQSRPVGTSAVQEVVAGAPMQDCTRTMVVTNHGFTPAARKLAELHGCTLVDGAELPRLRSTIRRLTQPIEPTST